jgi:hypothetical protein
MSAPIDRLWITIRATQIKLRDEYLDVTGYDATAIRDAYMIIANWVALDDFVAFEVNNILPY